MWFERDLSVYWTSKSQNTLPSRLLVGLRQCGKSSLLRASLPPVHRWISLDDLQNRELAKKDPGLLLDPPGTLTIVDEAQYAPELFPEIKSRIDRSREKPSEPGPVFWLTGSNRTLLDQAVRESLAGRVSYWFLHTLSVAEIRNANPTAALDDVFLRGGWPELWVHPELSATRYLNDYVTTFIEKDIVLAAGIEKLSAFQTFLGLLAARTGQMANFSEIAGQSGIESPTAQSWFGILERNQVCFRLPSYSRNLSKRIVKAPKTYFLDVGLAARLQGWADLEPLKKSPVIGALFETLVLGELVRVRDHRLLDLKLSYWRTREGEEVDFIVEGPNQKTIVIESKYASQNLSTPVLSSEFKKTVSNVSAKWLTTYGGDERNLQDGWQQVPIARLADRLEEFMKS